MHHVSIVPLNSTLQVEISPPNATFDKAARAIPKKYAVIQVGTAWAFRAEDRWLLDPLLFAALGLNFSGDGLDSVRDFARRASAAGKYHQLQKTAAALATSRS